MDAPKSDPQRRRHGPRVGGGEAEVDAYEKFLTSLKILKFGGGDELLFETKTLINIGQQNGTHRNGLAVQLPQNKPKILKTWLGLGTTNAESTSERILETC